MMVRLFAIFIVYCTIGFLFLYPYDIYAETSIQLPSVFDLATARPILTTEVLPIPEKMEEGVVPHGEEQGYDQPTIIEKAAVFFGDATEGLAKIIESVFQKYGQPNAYIEGQEISGAMTVGLRYGDGRLINHDGNVRRIYWQGPSIGFDLGLNASKVFILVYHLPKIELIFQRFPGVEGSLYYFAGIGVTYLESNGIVLAPIRLGMGFRTGASFGYMNITTSPSWNPF
ncbi:hypothetical protein CCP3SC5AM1_2280002 [Gammaproteobacteria bacterium]